MIDKHIDFETPDWGELAAPPTGRLGYASEVLADNPAAYWPLNESTGATLAEDVVGDNDLTLGSLASAGAAPLLADSTLQSVSLPGQLNGLLYRDPPATDLTPSLDQSVELWFRMDNLPFARGLFSFTPDASTSYYARVQSAGDVSVVWRLAGVFYTARTSAGSITPNKTYHLVVAVSASGTVKIYVNGVLDVASNPSIIWTATNQFRIGNVGGFHFPGRIDQVAVYDHELAAARIAAHYAAGVWELSTA